MKKSSKSKKLSIRNLASEHVEDFLWAMSRLRDRELAQFDGEPVLVSLDLQVLEAVSTPYLLIEPVRGVGFEAVSFAPSLHWRGDSGCLAISGAALVFSSLYSVEQVAAVLRKKKRCLPFAYDGEMSGHSPRNEPWIARLPCWVGGVPDDQEH